MKICVITPLFAVAGVPLAQVRFARALAARGHEVELIIGHIKNGYSFEPPKGIRTIIFNSQNVRSMLWPIMSYLRTERPDVVFSAEDHLNVVVLIAAILTGSNAKISGSSRVTPFDTYSNDFFSKRWILKHLSRLFMKRADALTCVSKDMVEQYQRVFNSPPHACVYNIVDDIYSRARMHEPVDHPWLLGKSTPVIVAAGRLAPWKGFSVLIEAFSLVRTNREVRLLILGDGPLRAELQEQINNHRLENMVEMVGYVQNPLKYFAHSDIFVLSSLVEGMPNVLVEAMMCGCTPVSTNCPTGPTELLQGGKYGYLVPVNSPGEMAKAIERALDNPIPKELLNEAITPFEESAVLDKHFRLLGIRG